MAWRRGAPTLESTHAARSHGRPGRRPLARGQAGDADRARVIDEIVSENMDNVMPVHCTGIKAICDLKTRLGEKCTVLTAGDEYVV